MKLEDQVVSLELAKRLKELGVKQISHFTWAEFYNKSSTVPDQLLHELLDEEKYEELHERTYIWEIRSCAAFSVAELGELLPQGYHSTRPNGYQWVCFSDKHDNGQSGKTEADCRAYMLIHLIENKLVTPPDAERKER